MRTDAIVIGAGMSGLAAALRLALFDRSVVLLERHEVWGGLNSFYTIGRRPFDVGLHALTNFAPPGERRAPLTRLLRALRIRHEELRLGEQRFSEILFPSARLTFTNDVAHMEAEVERAFPSQRDGFARLVRRVREHEVREDDVPSIGARSVLEEHLDEPLLRAMLCLPVLFYGSASEDDLDWQAFAILFRALFLEGLARPEGGIRTLLNLLVKRVKRAGVDVRMSSGVRRILVEEGCARGVELESGATLEAGAILSSAGWVETMRLAGRAVPRADIGRLSFLESIWVLDRAPAELGHGAATSFFSTRDGFSYRRPAGLVDTSCGVLSSPNNFQAAVPPQEGQMRVSVLANHERWRSLSGEEYARAKERAADEAAASAAGFGADWRGHCVFRDVFTPRTIEHFTGHAGGAVYGSPRKHLNGESGIRGLVLIGSDQGYLGVIGALLSGVTMANRHVLAPLARAGAGER